MFQNPPTLTSAPPRSYPAQHRVLLAAGTVVVALLALLAYQALPNRSFAADDFQWLIGARALSGADMLRSAFDLNQSHFYRPMVWVLFWLQARLFALEPHGYHAVSLLLHGANAWLLGWLVARVQARMHDPTKRMPSGATVLPILFAGAFLALHPGPFEAVVWVSAQSELLAAFWLLLMTHAVLSRHFVLATIALALALLTKESAVIGLPLLLVVGLWNDWRGRALGDSGRGDVAQTSNMADRSAGYLGLGARYTLPVLLTFAYLALQFQVERGNYIVDQGGYRLGGQVILNPLRSLALIVAPLPGSEHASAAWLVPLGLVVAVALVGWVVLAGTRRGMIGRLLPLTVLALTLAPTAPFVSPPDSRYLYLPVVAFATMGAIGLSMAGKQLWSPAINRTSRWGVAALLPLLLLYCTAETALREARFATAAGADGSLFTVANATCAAQTPDRVIVLNVPLAEVHARAVLDLACGETITPIFVDSWEVAEANLEPNSLIIDFPSGAARVAKQT